MAGFNTTGVLQNTPAPSAGKAGDANAGVKAADSEISSLDALQMLLDVIGLIPGLGAPADILNGLISAGRGDFWGAALSVFGAVPIAGEAATLGKIAKNSEKYLEALDVVTKKVLPHVPAGVRRKIEDAIAQARKKIDELSEAKPKPKPEPPPKAKDEKRKPGEKIKGRDCKHLEKGPPGAAHQGGKHGQVKKDSAVGVRESHHVPPDSVSPHGNSAGPSISMDYRDHRGMSSTGRSTMHPTSIAQANMAKSGPAGFLGAMMMEIAEIRAKHGNKYDPAIAWMLLWAACMGYIPGPKK